MFWKKLASRADETPSYELSFAGHELGCLKKVQKLKVFSMFFWLLEIDVIIQGPEWPFKLKNINFS